MSTTVESICDALLLSRLMSPDEVSAVRQRWFRPNRTGENDTERFAKWLVMNQYLTELQAQLLAKGQADSLFFNQYKLLDRIGKGRMAGVYKAVDPDGKVVAIKVLPPSKAKDPETLMRFQRESRLAMRLNHPNVVRTFEAGEANGMHYIVMEYIEGSTLEEVLQRRGRLTPIEAARIIGHALLGLQHLHEQQMIHRDLKPGNLMLATIPTKGKGLGASQRAVKIMDIGLGRAMFDEGEEAAGGGDLTEAGTLLGTLDYMAPEQAKDAHAADIRADIYSLGCVLYHCLAGQPAYKGMPFLTRHNEPPRALKDFVPDTPETLQQVVDQMLAPDPFQRYQTPAGAARAVRIFLNTEEQVAPPPETVVHANPKELEESQSVETDADHAGRQRRKGKRSSEGQQTALEALWDQVMPNDRELVSFFIGVVVVILCGGIFFVLTGKSIENVTLVAFGVALGVVIHWFWRKRRDSSP